MAYLEVWYTEARVQVTSLERMAGSLLGIKVNLVATLPISLLNSSVFPLLAYQIANNKDYSLEKRIVHF